MKSINLSEEKLKEYQRVAYYYYKAGLTQEDIAKRMNMSRQRVNRIVSACVDLGIVKITIQNLDKSNLELETALEQKYNLTGVRIVNNIVEENIVRELGIAAGTYLQSVLKKGDIIGVTRGRTNSRHGGSLDPFLTSSSGSYGDTTDRKRQRIGHLYRRQRHRIPPCGEAGGQGVFDARPCHRTQ